FDNTPSVDVSTGTNNAGNGAADPVIRASLATQSGDPTGCAAPDQLVLTVLNAATGDTTVTNAWSVDVGYIRYTLGSATPSANSGNPIGVSATDTPAGGTAAAVTASADAYVEPVALTANSPVVTLAGGQTGAISPVTGMELHPGELDSQPGATGPAEEVVSTDGGDFVGTVTLTATNTSGTWPTGMGIGPTAAGPFSGSVTLTPTDGSFTFFVTETNSTTGAATITASGLQVQASGAYGPKDVTIQEHYNLEGQTAFSNSGPSISTPAFDILADYRIQGYTADDTAVQSFTQAFGPFGEGLNRQDGFASAVLTADFEPYDALSANFLASELGTGVLITPENSVPQNVLNLLRNDDIGTVYIVGGPDAVSNAVQTQLAATQAYKNGQPVTVRKTVPPQPQDIQVVRIAGQTADDTAARVDQYDGFFVCDYLPATPGAYGTTYNDTGDTSGTSAASPFTSGDLSTVILASDTSYPDALSSGPLSYYDDIPVVLTPGNALSSFAAAAITNLDPEQVIIVGGPDAISDSVAASVMAIGPSVLRIAGMTASDTAQQLARYELNYWTQNSSANVRNGLDLAYCDGGCTIGVGSARGDSFSDALTSAEYLAGGWEGRGFEPLLLTQNTGTVGSDTAGFLTAAGTYDGIGSEHVNAGWIDTFGGTLAQTPALVQSELGDIAASGQL
ncbi:MAG: cell wall-binding repeat-containing protein, partial [Acidimicrobiales bacterium]